MVLPLISQIHEEGEARLQSQGSAGQNTAFFALNADPENGTWPRVTVGAQKDGWIL